MKIYALIITPLLLFTLSGCVKLWQDNLDIKTYMITAERPGDAERDRGAGKLWIEDVHVLPPYNVRSLAIRENDVQYSVSYYSELLMSPAENFRNIYFDWFSSSELFQEVSIANRQGYTHRMIATVMDFYGDRETEEAVLRIKVSLFDEEGALLIHKDYLERAKTAENTAEDYIRAYNEATAKILESCEQDVEAVLSMNRN